MVRRLIGYAVIALGCSTHPGTPSTRDAAGVAVRASASSKPPPSPKPDVVAPPVALAQTAVARVGAQATELTPARPLRAGERLDVWFSTRTRMMRGDHRSYPMMAATLSLPRLSWRREFESQTEPTHCSGRVGDDAVFRFECSGDGERVEGRAWVDGAELRVEFDAQREGGGGGRERYRVRLPAGARVAYHGGDWRL